MTDDPSPFAYIGSTLGNAYFSGIGFDMLFEAVCETHDESDNSFCPQTRVEVKKFERLDKSVSAAIAAKDWLEGIVKSHGRG